MEFKDIQKIIDDKIPNEKVMLRITSGCSSLRDAILTIKWRCFFDNDICADSCRVKFIDYYINKRYGESWVTINS